MRWMCLLLVSSCFAAPVSAATKLVHYGLFGNVHVAAPAGVPKRTVVFISDERGWDAREEAFASALSYDGSLVLGVDLPGYLKQMLSINDKCSLPAAHIEEMSDWMQRNQQLENFANPVLVGDGAGATFAYAIDAQAPKGTFTALVTLGYDFGFQLPKPLCPGDAGKITAPTGRSPSALGRSPSAPEAKDGREGPAEATDGRERPNGDGTFSIKPVRALPNPWLPLVLAAAPGRTLGLAQQMIKYVEAYTIGLPDAPQPGAGLPAAIDWLTASASAVPLPEDIADLPLIEVPAQGTPVERIAIILTGDGGWAGLDIAVADQLAKRGIAVVGLSSVKYFWQTRKPEESADALTRIIGHYGADRTRADFVVIGYSFGAALSPVLINRLPEAAHARVSAQVLISPDPEAVFEIHVGDWFGSTKHEGAIPIMPEIAKSTVPVICVHGADEGEDSFCSKLAGKPNVRQLELPGGHHYNGDYDKLGAGIAGSLPPRKK